MYAIRSYYDPVILPSYAVITLSYVLAMLFFDLALRGGSDHPWFAGTYYGCVAAQAALSVLSVAVGQAWISGFIAFLRCYLIVVLGYGVAAYVITSYSIHYTKLYDIAVDIDGRKRAEDERRRLEEESVARERRAREQNEAILEYIIHGPLTSGDLDASLRGLTELAARSFGVGRSSVWLYSDDDSEIACRNNFV